MSLSPAAKGKKHTVVQRSSSGAITSTFSSLTSISPLVLSHHTSNAPITLSLPKYLGPFHVATSNSGTAVELDERGDRHIEGLYASKTKIDGTVVGAAGRGEGNQCDVTSSNGAVKVVF